MESNQKITADIDRQGYLRPLADLLRGLEYTLAGGTPGASPMIASLSVDSREVGVSSLYVAIKGTRHDGHEYLEKAVMAGAIAAVVERGVIDTEKLATLGIITIAVADTRAALAALAASFYQNPASAMTMIGITGTNGKTTVSYLIEQVLQRFDVQTGVIGTIEYRYVSRDGGSVARPAPLTTPDPLTLQATLREMADSGVTHVIMEASSHALEQQRLGAIAFNLAVFTNLSQDHLDYHQTMDRYFAAKCLLFEKHMQVDGAVVVTTQNAEETTENWSHRVAQLCRSLSLKTHVCGQGLGSETRLIDFKSSMAGVSCWLVDTTGHQHQINSGLIGRFNVTNLQTAFATLQALGFEPARCADLLGTVSGAPGRIHPVRLADKPGGQPIAIVDYAHTPDALEKVLTALNELDHRRLICVFGCGGERDQAKRLLMGEIAARLADVVVVTDDNPRREDPALIREAVIEGVKQGSLLERSLDWLESGEHQDKGYIEIGGRGKAIHTAVTRSGPEDIVLIAGKGHETYQTVGQINRFFDDTLCVQQASLSWDLQSIAAATGGSIVHGNPEKVFANVSTDTRTIAGNDIFVALKGEVFDGHDFIDTAIKNGARCLIVSDIDRLKDIDICSVQVDDTLVALGDLANFQLQRVRKLSSPIVVGLTGSCGKTTVKEMTAVIFSCRWPDRDDQPSGRVLRTVGNFNNLIGLPLSLLPVSVHHRVLVLEMGMNCPGEIARLAEIGDPDICCITNVHQAHLEGLGTIEGVAAAKGELFEKSRPDAVHVINCDDEHIVRLGEKFSSDTVGFAVTEQGLRRKPEVWAETVTADENGHLNFILHVGASSAELVVQAPGLHNTTNSCAAAAIAHAAGIDFETILAGLKQFRPSANRMERLTSPAGLKILNDSYNANPASMASGLRTLGGLPARRRIAVLGDMLELGKASDDLHRSIGNVAAQSDLSYLGLVGNYADQIRQGALTSGMAPERIQVFTDKLEVVNWIGKLLKGSNLQAGDWLLVKASRGLALDTVVDQIMEQC